MGFLTEILKQNANISSTFIIQNSKDLYRFLTMTSHDGFNQKPVYSNCVEDYDFKKTDDGNVFIEVHLPELVDYIKNNTTITTSQPVINDDGSISVVHMESPLNVLPIGYVTPEIDVEHRAMVERENTTYYDVRKILFHGRFLNKLV